MSTGASGGSDDLWLTNRSLRRSDDPGAIKAAFSEWDAHLGEQAVFDGPTGRWLAERVSFRRLPHTPRLHVEFWISHSPDAAVQVNEPSTPASENPLSGLTVGEDGRRFIVRQGVLHKNNVSARVTGQAFQAQTGLSPASVAVDGAPARRTWYVVTPLDGISSSQIKDATADFALRCWNARVWGSEASSVGDQLRLNTLFGHRETGGWYSFTPSSTPQTVWREQGAVWNALETTLKPFGINLRKPRHAAGYEVDCVVEHSSPILVEIKTSVSASDIYTGVGQLTIYPLLIPGLQDYARVLLLPKPPSTALATAVQSAGVELHSYSSTHGDELRRISFTSKFLMRCGVPAKAAAKLGGIAAADQ